MKRNLVLAFLCLCAGAAATYVGLRPQPKPLPEAQAVVTQMREVARLETLDVDVYRKVSFEPEPEPSDGLWRELWSWARYNLRRPHGRAIIFATVHLGLDLHQLDAQAVRTDGREVWVVLPPVGVTVELKPGETEIIDSNLDSAETAQLLSHAQDAFARDAASDKVLRARTRRAAETALRALLLQLGFAGVHFVDALPQTPPRG